LDTFEREKTILAHDNPIGTLVTAKAMLFGGSLKVIKVCSLSLVTAKAMLFGGSLKVIKVCSESLVTAKAMLFGGHFS